MEFEDEVLVVGGLIFCTKKGIQKSDAYLHCVNFFAGDTTTVEKSDRYRLASIRFRFERRSARNLARRLVSLGFS